jgi:hypothetical protein
MSTSERTSNVEVELSGRLLAIVAVAMALLAVSAQPVAAGHANLAIGSQHTTDSDFSAAQKLDNVNVVGSGTAGSITVDARREDAKNRWAFDEGSGSTAYDDVGSDDLSLSTSTSWVSENGNTHLFTDGSGRAGTVNLADLSDGTNSTWSILLRPEPDDSNGSFAVNYYRPNLVVLGNNESLAFEVNTKSTWKSLGLNSPNFADGTMWFRATLVIKSDDQACAYLHYRNGTRIDRSCQSIGTVEYNGDDLDLGPKFWTSDGKPFRGTFGDFGVWKGAIPESKIDDLAIYQDAKLDWSGTYISSNHSTNDAVKAWANVSLSNETASVEVLGYNTTNDEWQVVNSSQYRSTGNYTLDVSEASYDTWRVNVTFEKTGSTPTAQLHDEGILVETKAPTVDNQSATPDTTGQSVDSPVDLTVSVDDSDFSNAGDSLTVDYYVDGSQVGSKQTSSAGEVTYTLSDVDAGSHSWHVEVHDEYGHTIISETFNFTTASSLQILDEENPSQLVKDNVTVTVRLYADDTVTKREVSDGTVDMSGLPLNSTIVATTQADGWIDRRVLIRDLTQQQEIYLLNSSSNAISVAFDLQDKSGNFPEDNSQLYVQKALNTTNTDGLEWQTVTGDYFGADGSFPTQLLYQQRYRLVIQNSQGDRRVLGNFIPTESGSFPVEIGKIVWDPPEGESVYATSETRNLSDNADHTYNNSSSEVFVEYYDSEDATTKLTINVSVRGNESLYSATVYDVQSHTESIPLTATQANKSLVVNVTAERTGEDFEHTWQHGTPGNVDTGADRGWLSLGAQVTLLALVGLVAGSMPKKGGLVVVPAAFGVSWMGWWQIHPASLSMMGVIALFSAARSRGGGA